MRLLPKEWIEIQPSTDGLHIMVSIYEHPEGYRWWDKRHLSDFPDDLLSRADFERCGINIVNGKSLVSEETH